MNLIYVLFLIETALFILSVVLTNKDIMAPSAIMCGMFAISTFCVFFKIQEWNVDYSFEAFLYTTSGLFVFSLTTWLINFSQKRRIIVFSRFSGRIRTREKRLSIQNWKAFLIILFQIFVLLYYLSEIMRITGEKGNPVAAFGMYRRMTAHIAGTSAAGAVSTGFVLNQCVRLVKCFGVVALYVMLNNTINYRFTLSDFTKYGTIVLLSRLPFIMAGDRGGILSFICMGVAQYYILYRQNVGWDKNVFRHFFKILIIIFIIMIPLFYFSLSLIGRSTDLNLFDYIAKYLGGGIQLFDVYVRNPLSSAWFGEESLIGVNRILQRLGFHVRARDMNMEYRVSGSLSSNTYTFFRRPLHDFGYLGMLFFTFLVAQLFSWIYFHKIKKQDRSFSTDQWILIYSQIIYWLVVSSVDQYSQSALTIGTVLSMVIVAVSYAFLTNRCVLAHGSLVLRMRGRRLPCEEPI